MEATRPPVIGIFIDRRDGEPWFKDGQYELAYVEIVETLVERGVDAVLLVGQGRYEGDGVFSMSWRPERRGSEIHHVQLGRKKVDIVFDKDFFIDDGKVPVINPQPLKELCENKHLSYQVLRQFHPKSSIVHTLEDFQHELEAMPNEVVAVKGLTGSSGKSVFVGSKREAVEGMRHVEYPYQVQEFIETVNGIPGVVDTRHDLRLLMMGGKPILATLRTPPEGSYKSNLGYGGLNRLVGLDELPAELFSMASRIDGVLERYAPFRLYSADFGLTAEGWKLFEVNGWPGVVTRERGEALAKRYQHDLSDYLVEMHRFYYDSKGERVG